MVWLNYIHGCLLSRYVLIDIWTAELLEVYGPCISTAGWDDWARHRKILAAPFNESIMKFVWDEALRQTKAMLNSWVDVQSTGIPSVQKDTQTLALGVLAATALQKSYDFRGSAETAVQDEAGSYRDTLQTVLNNAILISEYICTFDCQFCTKAKSHVIILSPCRVVGESSVLLFEAEFRQSQDMT